MGSRETFPYRGDIHRRLIDAARAGNTIAYSELGTGRGWVGTYLYRIAHEEDAAGRPPLTSIVVYKTTRRPGPGMREALKQIGFVRPGETESALWARATSEVFEYWRQKVAVDQFKSWRPTLSDRRSTWPRIRRQ